MYRDRQTCEGGPRSIRVENNSRIHPRSAHAASQPDFAALAKHYPGLSPHVQWSADGAASIDFRDELATRQLTRAILHNDHEIDWWIPRGHLIPPVTNRLNYIHWLQDLMQLSSPPGEVHGLDVGCGANCIYPLLGASVFGWRFVGTDIVPRTVSWAERNVARNPSLRGLIEVRQVAEAATSGGAAPSGMLLNAVRGGEAFHFSMCNPPFFASAEEAGRNPNTACGGTAAEMVCRGGELAFVQAMLEESASLGPRVHWYTTMLGKKSSLKELRKQLHAMRVPVVRSTQFYQGETSRWALAWSFAVDPGTAAVPLKRTPAEDGTAPARRFVSFVLRTGTRVQPLSVFNSIQQFLEARGVQCSADPIMQRLSGTWPAEHAAKRRRTESNGGGGGGIVGFKSMVYEECPRSVKVTGSQERPPADADCGETLSFNLLFGDLEAHLQSEFG
mmetsp:Transcript_14658/g.34872  ORF Transcript_14658/g.34872 Transcript_14658/m.34872 type:complete len:446 (+) Transcript_14658:653-1990(+)